MGYEKNYYISWEDTFENTEVTIICSFPYENSYKCSSVMINLGPSTRVGITELIRKLLKRGYKLNDVTYKSLDNKNHNIPHFLTINHILNPFEPYGQSFTINKHDQIAVYSEKELDRGKQIFKMVVQEERTTRSKYTEKIERCFLQWRFTLQFYCKIHQWRCIYL